MSVARRPEGLKGKVFRSRDVVAAGLLTRDALRSSAWRRLFRGIYADADLPDDPRLRMIGASLLMPAVAVFSGRTAAHLLGAEELHDPAGPLEVTLPPANRFGPVSGLHIRQAPLPVGDVRMAAGLRCTTALRTALDLARHEAVVEAVPALDVLLRRRLVLHEELASAAAALPVARGTRRARQAVALADGRAESPPESRVRVLLTLAGVPPTPQYRVLDLHGGFIARVDFAYPRLKVAIEYDGLWHAEAGQFQRDRRRLNRLVEAGWVVLHLTSADVRDPEALVARVLRLLRKREFGEVGA